jgi:thiamine biosynthesis lipoprotein
MSSAASPARILVQRAGRPMATDVSVQIAVAPDQEAAAATAEDACMAWFDEVDDRLSRFRPDSELSRLNLAAGQWFAASGVLYEAVAAAVRAAQASEGLFDPTLLRQIEALGYDRDFALIAHHGVPLGEPVAAPEKRAAWSEIALDERRRRIRLPQSVGLDLGGIAKGWAADVALNRYCIAFPGALVNVGGDLRARGGPAPEQAWSVGIRHPQHELAAPPDGSPLALASSASTYAAVITFSRGGLATSGALRRWWLRDGQRQHHLLDPRTGRPVPLWIDGDSEGAEGRSLIATATALAPTAARAEVAAKVALMRGYPDALRAVEAAWERYGAVGPETDADAGVALVLTFGDGEVVLSSNVQTYLATTGTDGAAVPMVLSTSPAPDRKERQA